MAILRSLGARETAVVAVSSVPPPTGIPELVAAVDSHFAAVDLASERAARRRTQALAEFAEEHGRKGMAALGGRRNAVKGLESLRPDLDVPEMVAELAARAGVQPT